MSEAMVITVLIVLIACGFVASRSRKGPKWPGPGAYA